MALSVERRLLLGHDLAACESGPHVGLAAVSAESPLQSSLSLCSLFPLVLSQKQIKHYLKKKMATSAKST